MIRFEQVTKIYDRASSPALNSVTAEIERGEFVFLVGASGSGKSTFIRLVQREERASSGSVHVLGRDVAKMPSWRVPLLRRELGVVFQDFRLLPNKTVFANVAFAMQVLGKRKALINQYVPEVLEMVGLGGKGKRMPHELSGGEQQRVAIARAVANRPAVLLADEPTGNLDPDTSWGIMEVLDRINQNGTTVVMATHDYNIVNTMRKRVIELSHGEIVRDEEHAGYSISAQAAEKRRKAQATIVEDQEPDPEFTPQLEPENQDLDPAPENNDDDAPAAAESVSEPQPQPEPDDSESAFTGSQVVSAREQNTEVFESKNEPDAPTEEGETK